MSTASRNIFMLWAGGILIGVTVSIVVNGSGGLAMPAVLGAAGVVLSAVVACFGRELLRRIPARVAAMSMFGVDEHNPAVIKRDKATLTQVMEIRDAILARPVTSVDLAIVARFFCDWSAVSSEH